LVRIPSVNGRENEATVAQRVIEEATRLGFDARLIAADPARPNALVEWGHGPASFALIGHLDTVAEGDPAAWTSPPFAAEIREGRLYGRGTADNKAGIACGLYTLALLRDRGEPDGLKTKKRGPKINLQAEANEKLRRENERLRVRLQQAETIIEAPNSPRCLVWRC
jgi:acetylornithine deacetylase/succinyl-diaminopimelate desuccinylase-like protein